MAKKKAGGGDRVWVGIDIGGTKMLAAVFDPSFQVLGTERKRTRGHAGVRAGMKRMVGVVEAALGKAGVEPAALAGIGVGCAGPIHPAKGILLQAPNLGWTNAPVGQALSRVFACPVHLVNDVDAGVYGEYRFGAAVGSESVVGVFPGTGIGAGAVVNGEILTGPTRSCLEIGHFCVMPEGPLCGCGQHGCLEAVAGRLSISAAAAAAAFRGAAPVLLENAGTDLARIRSKVLAQSIAGGDKVVKQIVCDAARWIGVGVATLVNLLAPDCVVLGGGLVEELADLYVGEVSRTAERRVMKPYRKTFRVVTAKLGDDAVVQGSAAWAEHQVSRAGKA